MQHVLILRHGQTDANAAGIVQGHLPIPLNPLGLEQSERLAARLATYTPKVTLLLTSPLIRAVETAAPIARALSLPALPTDAWCERHFGSGQGKPFDLHRIMTHGDLGTATAVPSSDPDDAEPKDLFDARVRAALDSLDPAHTTAVITHGGVIGSLFRQMMSNDIPTANPPMTRKPIPNCSILHLERKTPQGPWHIHRLNDDAHLQGLATDTDAG